MAKVIGESGRYVTDAAERESQRLFLHVVILMGLLGLIEGFVLASLVGRAALPNWATAAVTVGTVAGVLFLSRWGLRRLDTIDKRRRAFRRGAEGENRVSQTLARFPNGFFVVNDLATPFGNLDHVVVGPTGVFILDAKAWRGVVSADGKGELLRNGQPTEKPEIRRFLSRTLSVRDRVRALAPGLDPFYQPLFVFTSARVEAKWGTTRTVHCLREDQLHDYIVEKNFGKRLGCAEVDKLAQAFLALAKMDTGFGSTAASSQDVKAAA